MPDSNVQIQNIRGNHFQYNYNIEYQSEALPHTTMRPMGKDKV